MLSSEALQRRNHVQLSGEGARPVLLLHGFGTDQTVWTRQEEALCGQYQVILYDHVGCGRSDLSAYSTKRYNSLLAYAEDLVEVCAALEAGPVVAVGHSVSGMIAALASTLAPELFRALILLGASARYMDDEGYEGGFTRADVDATLAAASRDYCEWIEGFAPAMVEEEDKDSSRYLNDALRQMRPDIALSILKVMLNSDHRRDVCGVSVPTWILQSRVDRAFPESAAQFLHKAIPGSHYKQLPTTGHLPHLSAPEVVTKELLEILSKLT